MLQYFPNYFTRSQKNYFSIQDLFLTFSHQPVFLSLEEKQEQLISTRHVLPVKGIFRESRKPNYFYLISCPHGLWKWAKSFRKAVLHLNWLLLQNANLPCQHIQNVKLAYWMTSRKRKIANDVAKIGDKIHNAVGYTCINIPAMYIYSCVIWKWLK